MGKGASEKSGILCSWEGPLGTPLGSVQWKRASSRVDYANQPLNRLLETTDLSDINNHPNLVQLGAAVYLRIAFNATR